MNQFKSLIIRLAKIFQKFIHPLSTSERQATIDEVTPLTVPSFDFYLLVILSCSIATLGLITDSPAVIIGAMLLAPLMSPIIGIGLSSITGDDHMLRSSVLTLLIGAGIAIVLSFFMTLVNHFLPFVALQELPGEVLARMRPTPIDLLIALAGGLAASYALTRPNLSTALPGVAIATALMPPLCTIGIGIAMYRWDVAGGATLLFLTNMVTIAFAAAAVFFLRGFSTKKTLSDQKIPRNLIVSLSLVIILLIPLTYYSVKFFNEATENRKINSVVVEEVNKFNNSELVDLTVGRTNETLNMVITIRTSKALSYEEVVALQQTIVNGLDKPVSLKVEQVIAEELDPLIPPTPTFTPTLTATATPGPSATPTPTFTPTNTFTPSPTATPAQILLSTAQLPLLQLYQTPGGPVIGKLRAGQWIKKLYQEQTFEGIIWIQVMDADGRIGWIPKSYLAAATSTPTPNATSLATPSQEQ
ncbi:MAG: DUF389 domain-containing protein [Anaerolineaceae bacterium]|nr:DUF389 domain-containing protein [Anaerolineaceae bacterium]